MSASRGNRSAVNSPLIRLVACLVRLPLIGNCMSG